MPLIAEFDWLRPCASQESLLTFIIEPQSSMLTNSKNTVCVSSITKYYHSMNISYKYYCQSKWIDWQQYLSTCWIGNNLEIVLVDVTKVFQTCRVLNASTTVWRVESWRRPLARSWSRTCCRRRSRRWFAGRRCCQSAAGSRGDRCRRVPAPYC